jgi:hypothetical protein
MARESISDCDTEKQDYGLIRLEVVRQVMRKSHQGSRQSKQKRHIEAVTDICGFQRAKS